jgi:hypothetical protein
VEHSYEHGSGLVGSKKRGEFVDWLGVSDPCKPTGIHEDRSAVITD